MFKSEDFELTLESQLKLRVLTDEITGCSDVEQLRSNLIEMSTLCMRYQRIIESLLKEQITQNLEEFEALSKEMLKDDKG